MTVPFSLWSECRAIPWSGHRPPLQFKTIRQRGHKILRLRHSMRAQFHLLVNGVVWYYCPLWL